MSIDKKNILFEQAYEEFKVYAQKRHKEQGYETFIRNFKLHILPYFKGRQVSELTKIDIVNWQNEIIDKDFSNGFNDNLYYEFSSFIKFCMLNSYIDENIVLSVDKFKKKNEYKEYDYYTLFEFRRFRKHLDNYVIKQFFNFMFFCGTRPSEAMGLRFCDLKGNFVHIQHSIQRRGKRKLDTPKNKSSIRYVKLSLLMRFRLFKLRCYYIKHNGSCNDDYFLFGGQKPLSTSTVDRRKEKACKMANIRQITQHQFRHSFVTNKIHHKKPIDEVSKDIGHSRVSTTVDVYLHQRKRVPSTQHTRFIFLYNFCETIKNITQSIITFFM